MMLLGHSIHLQAPGESVDLQRFRAIGKAIKPVPKSGLVVWMLLCRVRLGYTPAYHGDPWGCVWDRCSVKHLLKPQSPTFGT